MEKYNLYDYLSLIDDLINCTEGEELEILLSRKYLVNSYLIRVMELKAERLSEEGDENTAHWLQALAEEITEVIGNPEPIFTQEEYLDLLMEVFRVTGFSGGEASIVYPVLKANVKKLDLEFVRVFQDWANTIFMDIKSAKKQEIAVDIANFSNLIQDFPLGKTAYNFEIAIAGYEIALTVFTREAFPVRWGMIKNNLANAYKNRILENTSENIEKAIFAYKQALEVRTRDGYPYDWAMTQNNLGIAYRKRIQGDKAKNIEKSIAAYEAGLEVYNPFDHPKDWAGTQNNLGNAYCQRILGDKSENLELYKFIILVNIRKNGRWLK
jgi:tetratricopeptide (TPR) repeat protein